MPYIRLLSDLRATDAATAGGKGASLGEMTHAGIPVPPGYVILTSAFQTFLAENGLHTAIAAKLKTADYHNPHSVEHLLENVKKCWASLFTQRALS